MLKTIVTTTVVGGVFFLQIVTKQFGLTTPAQVIHSLTIKLGTASEIVGYYLAKFSDLVGFVKTTFKNVIELCQPVYNMLRDAATDLFGEVYHLAWDPTNKFINGYFSAMDEGVYNQLMTMLTSIFYIFGGSIGLAVIMECVGMVWKKDSLRPSMYLRKFGKYLYEQFSFVSETYIKLCNVCNYIVHIWNTVRHYIGPYAEHLEAACISLIDSGQYFIVQPILGSIHGIEKALIDMKVTYESDESPSSEKNSKHNNLMSLILSNSRPVAIVTSVGLFSVFVYSVGHWMGKF